jgi:hypothetical protein
MLTNYPWFGPRDGVSWGWTPLTWEGWMVSLVCIAAILAAYFYYGKTRRLYYVTGASLSVLLVICVLTGTAPG